MKIDKNGFRFKLNNLTGTATNYAEGKCREKYKEKYKGISKIPLNRWSTKMKKHEIAIVAFITRRISWQFGYQFVNTKYELTAPTL
mgnify:CR=1 FL=1|tara:strand:- start:152 stop:409 length:258 start_codon:yes stop_codon:yes gene_type:complete